MKSTFTVRGMTCASCVSAVERTLASQVGVMHVSVNLATQKATIEYDHTQVTPEMMQSSLHRIGYELEIQNLSSSSEDGALQMATEKRKLLRKRLRMVIVFTLSMVIMYLSMMDMSSKATPYLVWGLSTIVLFVFGLHSLLLELVCVWGN